MKCLMDLANVVYSDTRCRSDISPEKYQKEHNEGLGLRTSMSRWDIDNWTPTKTWKSVVPLWNIHKRLSDPVFEKKMLKTLDLVKCIFFHL